MTVTEMSDEMDVLLRAFSSDKEFGEDASKTDIRLDEYEKSVYLTRAQEQLVLSLYNGKNYDGEGFEQTEELRRYLSELVKEINLSPMAGKDLIGVSSQSVFFKLPDDLWFITYEAVKGISSKCTGTQVMDVYPVTQDEYHRIRRNPFRGANSRRVLRLDLGSNVVEIVGTVIVRKYYVRYLSKLSPIVLVNLGTEPSVDGMRKETPCKLHESLHRKIVELAARMAVTGRVSQ